MIAMAHRGKLELLTCVLGFPPATIFCKVSNMLCFSKKKSWKFWKLGRSEGMMNLIKLSTAPFQCCFIVLTYSLGYG